MREVVANHDGLLRQTAAFVHRQPENRRTRLIHTGFLTRNKAVHLVGNAEVLQLFHLDIRQHIGADGHLNARRTQLVQKLSHARAQGHLSEHRIPVHAECLARIANGVQAHALECTLCKQHTVMRRRHGRLLPCQTLAVDAECVREPLAFVSKRADGPLLQLFVGVGVPGLKAGV